MPTITVDDEVYRYLQERARPFVDSPNVVLRRELGIEAPAVVTSPPGLRRDATGLGDDDRYLRGVVATVLVDGKVRHRSGSRSPRRRSQSTADVGGKTCRP